MYYVIHDFQKVFIVKCTYKLSDPIVSQNLNKKLREDGFVFLPGFLRADTGRDFEKLASFPLGDEVTGKNLQYFNKPAGIGQATPPHQDGYYFKLVPNFKMLLISSFWFVNSAVEELLRRREGKKRHKER